MKITRKLSKRPIIFFALVFPHFLNHENKYEPTKDCEDALNEEGREVINKIKRNIKRYSFHLFDF